MEATELFLIFNAGFNDYSFKREAVSSREEAKSIVLYNITYNAKYVCFCWSQAEAETMIKNLSGKY